MLPDVCANPLRMRPICAPASEACSHATIPKSGRRLRHTSVLTPTNPASCYLSHPQTPTRRLRSQGDGDIAVCRIPLRPDCPSHGLANSEDIPEAWALVARLSPERRGTSRKQGNARLANLRGSRMSAIPRPSRASARFVRTLHLRSERLRHKLRSCPRQGISSKWMREHHTPGTTGHIQGNLTTTHSGHRDANAIRMFSDWRDGHPKRDEHSESFGV